MKLRKFISKSITTTILLGATFIAASSSINISVGANDIHQTVGKSNDQTQKTQSNITTGTQADINQGLLSLESVPNLNFSSNDDGNITNSNQLKLNDGNVDNSGNSGTNYNSLRVADYRNTTSSNHGGWTLTASLGNFNNYSGSQYGDTSKNVQPDGWTIYMNNNNPDDSYSANNYDRYGSNGQKDPNSPNNSPSIQNNTELQSNGNVSAPIIGTSNNYNKGHGLTNITYGNNDATLNTPYNVQPGKYNATISWNLSSKIDGSDNESGK